MVIGADSRYWSGTRFPPAIGVKFYYGKVSDASWKPEDVRHLLLEHQRRACDRRGLPYGGFHYHRQAYSSIAQVDMFAAKLQPGYKLPPALDFEDPYAKVDCGSSVLALVREAVAVFGGRPIVYTRKGWWDSWVNAEQAAEIASLCDLWVAHYTTAAAPLLPRGWSDWQVWQYAGDVTAPGVNAKVDWNRAKPEWAAKYGIV